MRALALLLIFANICFFFWAHYIDVPEAAPLVASAPLAKQPARLLLAREQQTPATASATVGGSIDTLTCISVGPFGSDDEMSQVQQRLRDAGFMAESRSESGEVFGGYWVSLQGMATRADAEQALKRLHGEGISDAYILPADAGANGQTNVLSLGLFSEKPRAEQRRDAIAQLGFQPTVQNRMRQGEVRWLDVTLQAPGQLIDPALLQPASGGIVRLETKGCPAAPATTNATH